MNILFTSMNSEPIAIKLIAIGEPTTGANKYTTDTLTSSQDYNIGDWITTESGFINFDYRGKSLNESNYYKFITSGGDIAISGNMGASNRYCHYNMFKDCKNIIDASGIKFGSFIGIHGLQNMFANCSNLTGAPSKFPEYCRNWCYAGMFANCTSLKEVSAALRSSSTGSYAWMFQNCISLTAVPKFSSFSNRPYSYNGMFQNCISLKEAPELSQIYVYPSCYKNMFMDCKSLSSITVTFTNWESDSAPNMTENWVKGVSYNGIFNKKKELASEYGPSRIPYGWIDGSTLTFKAVDGPATIQLSAVGNPYTVSLNYRKRNGQWTQYDIGSVINLQENEFVSISGNNSNFSKTTDDYYQFAMSGQVESYGNVMSLMNYRTSCKDNCFNRLFYQCSSLLTAPQLPATTLAPWCYYFMFCECTNLTVVPQLPAKTMKECCYDTMFGGCISLTAAPQLPATTLANKCYGGMFAGCSGLTVAPYLPSADFSQVEDSNNGCYYQMFRNCTSLSSITVAFTEWGYSMRWVRNVAANGIFYKPTALPEMVNQSNRIPPGWTVINTDEQQGE